MVGFWLAGSFVAGARAGDLGDEMPSNSRADLLLPRSRADFLMGTSSVELDPSPARTEGKNVSEIYTVILVPVIFLMK